MPRRPRLAGNWKEGPAKLGDYPYGLPVPANLSDRIYNVYGTKVYSDPTLNPVALWSVPPSTARLVRQAASSADAVAHKWRQLAWLDPAEATTAGGTGTGHTLAARWVSELATPDAPKHATLARGPMTCPSKGEVAKTLQGAPDYRLMLWYGCGTQVNWLNNDTNVKLRPVKTDVHVGPSVDRIYVLTNPSSTKVLDVYVTWTATSALHIAPTGQKAWTFETVLKGEMVLRPGPSGYRIWNPWRRYGFSGHDVPD